MYDLYLIKQGIVVSFDFMILNTLSCEYLKVLPFLKVTLIIVFVPISDLRTTNLFEFRICIVIKYLLVYYIIQLSNYFVCNYFIIIKTIIVISFYLHYYYPIITLFCL